MTPFDLRAWQKTMGYTYETAAQALGISRASYAAKLAGTSDIDRCMALACAALAAGLDEWRRLELYAHPDDWQKIKDLAKELRRKRAKSSPSLTKPKE